MDRATQTDRRTPKTRAGILPAHPPGGSMTTADTTPAASSGRLHRGRRPGAARVGAARAAAPPWVPGGRRAGRGGAAVFESTPTTAPSAAPRWCDTHPTGGRRCPTALPAGSAESAIVEWVKREATRQRPRRTHSRVRAHSAGGARRPRRGTACLTETLRAGREPRGDLPFTDAARPRARHLRRRPAPARRTGR